MNNNDQINNTNQQGESGNTNAENTAPAVQRRRLTVKRTVNIPTGPENGGRHPAQDSLPPSPTPAAERLEVKEEMKPEKEPETVKGASEIKKVPARKPEKAAKAKKVKKEKAPKAPKKKKEKKKAREKGKVSPLAVCLWLFLIVAFITAALIIYIFSTGNKYEKSDYVDGDVSYSVIYFGTKDENGAILEGKLRFSDGTDADIKASTDGNYLITYSNGDVYLGGFSDFHRNGQGRLTMKNGDVYQGKFHYDRMWGSGEYTYAYGDVYQGEFKDNRKCGQGKYIFANGDIYEGAFDNDMRNGYGKYTYNDGSVYEGIYVNNKRNDPNAKMTIMYSDGSCDTYVGGFVDDKREGYGEYTWASGDSYVGNFASNNINGMGKYTWASGRTYEGMFLNGNIVKDFEVYPTLTPTSDPEN